ncbi:MAG: WYL domain-containing protein [Candidatus Nanopelagicales bacterium]|nr:WYL domain-containing protein [Candidatus Nanopelagicales bacterium]
MNPGGMRTAGQEKTERQLALVLLLTGCDRPVTKAEIRQAIDEYASGNDLAFERMFERDKDDLRRVGIPIASSVNPAGADAYSIRREDALLQPLELTEAERWALVCAAGAWGEASWESTATRAIRKIESAGRFVTPDPPAWRVEGASGTQLIGPILTAIRSRRAVGFDYRKLGKSSGETRHVEPWSLASVRGRWYLIGRDRDRDAPRSFRLSRIAGKAKIIGSEDSFAIPAAEQVARLTESVRTRPDGHGFTSARILVSPGTGYQIRSLGKVAESGEGGDVIEITDVSTDRLLSEVLRAGSDAVVLDPEELRQDACSRLTWLVKHVEATEVMDAESVQVLLDHPGAPRVARSQTKAAESLARLLAVVPWLKENPGVTLEEAAKKFDVTPEQLFSELEIAVCTEVGRGHPLIDISIWDSNLEVIDPLSIDQPLRLSRDEAVSLLIGLRLLADSDDDVTAGVVASVAGKLRQVTLDSTPELDQVAVIDPARPRNDIERAVVEGLEQRLALHISYWTASRDEMTERTIEPLRISWVDGIGYLEAYCRAACAVRTFRLDRIRECEVLAEPVEAGRIGSGSEDEPVLSPDGPRAILLLDPDAAWLTEVVPLAEVSYLDDGSIAMVLPVASEQWAIRQVMSVAPLARVVNPPDLAEAIREEAAAALRKYDLAGPWSYGDIHAE